MNSEKWILDLREKIILLGGSIAIPAIKDIDYNMWEKITEAIEIFNSLLHKKLKKPLLSREDQIMLSIAELGILRNLINPP